jgi:hypothetical protein
MVTRRRYKGYRDGGVVVADIVDEPPPPPEIAKVADDDSPLKKALEAAQRAEMHAHAQAQRQAPMQDFEGRIAHFPDQAKTWLRAHPEFVHDESQARRIGGVHSYLVDSKGVEAFSPAYFDALDSEFGFSSPAHQHQPPARRSIPMTAPVSREVPMSSGQRTLDTRQITLSAEERAVARNSFSDASMSNEERERLYAQNKARMLVAKARGEIQ